MGHIGHGDSSSLDKSVESEYVTRAPDSREGSQCTASYWQTSDNYKVPTEAMPIVLGFSEQSIA